MLLIDHLFALPGLEELLESCCVLHSYGYFQRVCVCVCVCACAISYEQTCDLFTIFSGTDDEGKLTTDALKLTRVLLFKKYVK